MRFGFHLLDPACCFSLFRSCLKSPQGCCSPGQRRGFPSLLNLAVDTSISFAVSVWRQGMSLLGGRRLERQTGGLSLAGSGTSEADGAIGTTALP